MAKAMIIPPGWQVLRQYCIEQRLNYSTIYHCLNFEIQGITKRLGSLILIPESTNPAIFKDALNRRAKIKARRAKYKQQSKALPSPHLTKLMQDCKVMA